MKRQVVAIVTVLLVLFTAKVQAQHANRVRGFQPHGAYSSFDINHINLFKGNLVVNIPIGRSYPVNGKLS